MPFCESRVRWGIYIYLASRYYAQSLQSRCRSCCSMVRAMPSAWYFCIMLLSQAVRNCDGWIWRWINYLEFWLSNKRKAIIISTCNSSGQNGCVSVTRVRLLISALFDGRKTFLTAIFSVIQIQSENLRFKPPEIIHNAHFKTDFFLLFF